MQGNTPRCSENGPEIEAGMLFKCAVDLDGQLDGGPDGQSTEGRDNTEDCRIPRERSHSVERPVILTERYEVDTRCRVGHLDCSTNVRRECM